MKRLGALALMSLSLAQSPVAQVLESPPFLDSAVGFAGAVDRVEPIDYDRDGRLDLVGVGTDENGFLFSQLAVNRGDGGFFPLTPKLLAFDGHVRALDAEDVNGDGLPDLVVVTDQLGSGPRLLVALNGPFGPSTFEVLFTLPLVATLSGVVSVEVVDVDSDQIPDVVVGAFKGVTVLRGRGDGTFEPDMLAYSTFDAAAVEVADLDFDGISDIVVADESLDLITILRGDGLGGFDVFESHVITEPSDLAIADLDDDGDLDIACASLTPGGTAVLLSAGGATFTPPSAVATLLSTGLIEAGDYDNDGTIDLVALVDGASGASALIVLRGAGDGTFAGVKGVTVQTDSVVDLIAANINGDIAIDWITVSDEPLVALGQPGDLEITADVFTAQKDSRDVILVDLDGDGLDDLVRQREFDIVVNLWSGAEFSANASLGVFDARGGVAVGDINGDAVLDIAWSASLTSVVFGALGNGDGTFAPTQALDLGTAGVTRGVTIGDLDGDGDGEIITSVELGPSAHVLRIFESDAGGVLTLAATLNNVEGSGSEIEARDVDNDGAADLLLVTSDRTFSFRRSIPGSLDFAPASTLDFPADAADPVAFEVGRLLADDGVDDIAFLVDGALVIFDGNPSAGPDAVVFDFERTIALGNGYVGGGLCAIDENGDEFLDVIVLAPTSGEFLVYRWRPDFGSGGFELVQRVSSTARQCASGRMNDDGQEDFVSAGDGLGPLRIFLRQPQQPWFSVGGATAPLEADLPTLLASGDPSQGSAVRLEYSNGLPGVQPILVVGLSGSSFGPKLQGGVVVPSPDILIPLPFTDGFGDLGLDLTWTNFPPGIHLWTQVWQVSGPATRASQALIVESR